MTTEAPPVETPPVAPEPVAESLLSSIRVLRPNSAPPEVVVDQKEPEPVTEPEKPEAIKEPEPIKAPEPVKAEDDPTKGLSEPAAKRFKNLEKHKVQAEQERDTARKELETIRTEHTQLQEQLRDIENMRKQAEKAIADSQTAREELRKVSIERDPEFQKQYNGQIMSRQQQMLDMAVQHGTAQTEFVQAINSGNEEALEAIRDMLPAAKQRLWDANRVDIEKLAYEKKEAIRNADKTWESIEEQRKRQTVEMIERTKAENISMAKNAVTQIWSEIPGMDQVDLEVKGEVESWLTSIVVNSPREQIARHLVVGQIAQKALEGVQSEVTRLNTELESKNKEIEEIKEKLGEQETFIKDMSSRTPRPSINGNGSLPTENGSLLGSVKVRLPGR